MTVIQEATTHPKDTLLRVDRFPHIWCPTCGIGTAVSCFIDAIRATGIDEKQFAVVSGIGCTGRVAGYIRLDSFHTTHGRAIPFAVGLHLAKPDMKVIVFSGDGDISCIGGNHLIHTARRNMDITVICVNNFIYGMTGGQLAPTTPQTARTTTSPYGNFEYPMSLPHVVSACGATYVSRWTVLHIKRLTRAMKDAILHRGFSFVEVIAPCSTLCARKNRLGTGTNMLSYYHDHCEINHEANLADVGLDYQGKIVCGNFLTIEKPTFRDLLEENREEV
ncbi:2-oxoacid:ferredoxin oxidoreductase subunit beta [bacterium]|nr:2-oxoacid:ferredoxin oxidoreductase subunit beta [bacterium]